MTRYTWNCNRCETSAEDTSRAGVELFAAHHVRTMHAWLNRLDERERRNFKPVRRRMTSRPERSPRLRIV